MKLLFSSFVCFLFLPSLAFSSLLTPTTNPFTDSRVTSSYELLKTEETLVYDRLSLNISLPYQLQYLEYQYALSTSSQLGFQDIVDKLSSLESVASIHLNQNGTQSAEQIRIEAEKQSYQHMNQYLQEQQTTLASYDENALEDIWQSGEETLHWLLKESKKSPLISIQSQEKFTQLIRNKERHYALVMLLTATHGCAGCRVAEKEIVSISADFERARWFGGSSLPRHHIFFIAFDAHVAQNMKWFQLHNFLQVPFLYVLNVSGTEKFRFTHIFNNPAFQIAATSTSTSVASSPATLLNSEDDIYLTVNSPSAAHSLRMNHVQDQRLRRRDIAYAKTAAGKLYFRDEKTKLKAQQLDVAQKYLNTFFKPWTQHEFTVVNGISTDRFLSFLDSIFHLKAFNPAKKQHNTDKAEHDDIFDASADAISTLPRHLLIHEDGVFLQTFRPKVEENPTESEDKKVHEPLDVKYVVSNLIKLAVTLLLRVYSSLENFMSLICLNIGFFLLWRRGVMPLWAIACFFYNWNVVGSMFNIIRRSEFMAMSPRGQIMLYYPGQGGQFVFECIIVGVLYALCSICIGLMASARTFNRLSNAWILFSRQQAAYVLKEWNRVDPQNTPQPPPSEQTEDSAVGTSEATTAPSTMDELGLEPNLFPSSSGSTSSLYEILERRQNEERVCSIPTQVIVSVFALHVFFAMLRYLATEKNGSYRYGYLI